MATDMSVDAGMARELLILRHGKATRPTGMADADRPLSRRGEDQSDRIGALLRRDGLLPDLVVSSPALRALETARRAVRAAGLDPAAIVTDPRVYEATADHLIAVIAGRAAMARRLLLVGHNPGLEYLASLLAAVPVAMGTGDLVRLGVTAPWRRLGAEPARLLSHVDPDGLADDGG